MDAETMARVARGVSGREYSLFLGAGASIGSLGGNGESLPSGRGLTESLIEEFTIPADPGSITLTRAYAAAKRKDSGRLEQFMRAWFTDCKPDWQQQLVDVDWHRIWTLNIDDIIEVACRDKNVNVDRFTWTSKFRDRSDSERQIIHLHGYARGSLGPDQPASELVFSVQEYVATLKDSRAWHAVFTDEFAERPFIILGASLIDEFDLQQAFANSAAARAREYPSVIVLKEVSPLEREELSDLGLIIVELDARSFVQQLCSEVGGDVHGVAPPATAPSPASRPPSRELLLSGQIGIPTPSTEAISSNADVDRTTASDEQTVDRRCPDCDEQNARLRRDWYDRARPMRCLSCNGTFGRTRVKRCPGCGSRRARLRSDWYRRARPMRCRDCNVVYGGADERAPGEPVVGKTPHLERLLHEALGGVRMDRAALVDRAQGVMIGIAAGNLLGLGAEGWSHQRIASKFPDGLRDIDPKEGALPMDDDLAQSVELAEALLDKGDTIDRFANRLIAWRHNNGKGMGHTTRQSIAQLEDGMEPPHGAYAVYRAKGNIAPNGGIMRCAPAAIHHRTVPGLMIRVSADTCAVTHYSPLSQWSCVIVNAAIAMLLGGCEPDLRRLLAAAEADGCPDLLSAGQKAGIDVTVLERAASGRPSPESANWLRDNQSLKGHTLLTLQAGLWATATHLGFEESLIAVVNAGGDTDTNGALAGAVLGVRHGATAVPLRWTTCIAQKERLAGLGERLLTA
jgi:ADP-ribosylglycohydrolase